MARHQFLEIGIDLLRLVAIAALRQIASIKVRHPQRIAAGRVSLRQHHIGYLVSSRNICDQPAMQIAEHAECFLALQTIDRFHRTPEFLRTHQGPGRKQRGGQISRPPPPALVQIGPRLRILPRLDPANAKRQTRDLVTRFLLRDPLGQLQRIGHLPFRKQCHKGPLDQLAAFRVFFQGLCVIKSRHRRVL